MATRYTQDELDRAYEKLPEELKEALFSMETADALWNIGERHDVMDQRYDEIVKYVTYVLMGLVLPSEFQGILEKEVKLPKNIAKEIARDINRFVFYPVRPVLEKLHGTEVRVSESVAPEPAAREAQEQIKKEAPTGPDTYREPIT